MSDKVPERTVEVDDVELRTSVSMCSVIVLRVFVGGLKSLGLRRSLLGLLPSAGSGKLRGPVRLGGGKERVEGGESTLSKLNCLSAGLSSSMSIWGDWEKTRGDADCGGE